MLINIGQLVQKLAISKPTAYRMIAKGTLIQPILIGGRSKRYISQELDYYIKGVASGKDPATIVEEIMELRN